MRQIEEMSENEKKLTENSDEKERAKKEKTKKNKRNAIKKDLLNQLKKNGTAKKYYTDLVEDYIKLWDAKEALSEDIEERGVTVEYNNGGGQRGTKQNDSVALFLKVNERMTRMLDSMGIKPSTVATVEDDDEL